MLNAIRDFSRSSKNGLFINSCFAHCQSERQDTWFADDSPLVADMVCSISISVAVSHTGIVKLFISKFTYISSFSGFHVYACLSIYHILSDAICDLRVRKHTF